MSRLEKLNEQRQRAVADMRKYADLMAEGKGDGQTEEAYTKANAEIDRLGKLMADERSVAKADTEWADAVGEAQERSGAQAGNTRETRESKPAGSEFRNQIMAALETRGVPDSHGIKQLPAGVRGSFTVPMPDPRHLATAEGRAALVTNVATRGPEVLDQTLVNTLFSVLFDDATILSAGVTVLRTDTGNPLKFPKLISRGALTQANARRTETQQIQKAEPTLSQIELGSHKYAQIMQASSEVVRDAIIAIESLLGNNLGALLAEYIGYDLLLGTGTGQPRGVATIVSAGSNKVTRTTTPAGHTAHVPTYDDLLDVMWKLKPAYRRNGKWLLNDATVLPLRKIKDTQGNYLWAPGDATTPDTLHNRPVLVEPNMAVFAEDALSMIYGDFSKYYVRFVGQTRIDWSTEYAFDTDMTSVRGIVHGDGDAIDDTAFAGFVSSLV